MLLSLDLGTSSNRCLAINKKGQIIAVEQEEFTQHFPHPAWVEHDANEIWQSTLTVLNNCLKRIPVEEVTAIAITNQRETTVAWDKNSGEPLHRAIVWQCRRTAERMANLDNETKTLIKEKTGLIPDAYFSASKMEWLLKHSPSVQKAAHSNTLCFGTIDSFILWKLTNGKSFATDSSNASRTLLVNIHKKHYDPELCKLFNIRQEWLPEIKDSDSHFGDTATEYSQGRALPIHAILGDQQASLFAQCGSDTSQVKNTYGTGLFICACTGDQPIESETLLSTIAWSRNSHTEYAVEGSVFIGGSVIQWCRDALEIIKSSSDSQSLAEDLPSNEGVYFVPALSGLGAPHWDSSARGMIIGLTRGSGKAHIVRAALESLAYQTKDVLDEIQAQVSPFQTLKVDGGAVSNNFLMQFQADICEITVEKPQIIETTALGVAGMAGIATNLFSEKEFRDFLKPEKRYSPTFKKEEIAVYYNQWKQAINKAKHWHQ